MKKLLIILFILCAIKSLKAQVKGVVIDHVKYHITTLNFHKPRTDCTSGFGFCFKGHYDIRAHWEFSRSVPVTSVVGNEVYIYAIRSGKIFSVHITADLQRAAGYANTDFTKFILEDGYELDFNDGSSNVILKAGTYPVTRTKSEYVIDVATL